MNRLPGGFSPLIAIDRNAAQPLHGQIYDAFRTGILHRDLQPGQQVPSTRALAADLGISRIPVLTAYMQLTAEGYFEGRVGAGTFVSASLRDQNTAGDGRARVRANADSAPFAISRTAQLLPRRSDAPWSLGSGAFSIGQLAFDHFPLQVWSNLVARHARRVRVSDLNYGDPMGAIEFRETVAAYLGTCRAVRCDARQVMIIGGSQAALDLSIRVLLEPGAAVWMEEPGYELMRSALTLAGCRVVPVPVDEGGLDVRAGKRRAPKAGAAYVTPSHQYPLGVTMSATRRLQLLEWAHEAGAWILEDDYDSEYRYETMPIASLQGLDDDGRVIYIGTFSKTLFPSVRLGYIVIPAALVDRFVAVRRATDLCPPRLYQAVLADFIAQGHFARHIRKTRMVYGERRRALVDALGREFGSALQMVGKEAGMHLAVMLPPGVADREVSARAASENLWLWPLSACYVGRNAKSGFVLGFGSTRTSDIPGAVRRVRLLLERGKWL